MLKFGSQTGSFVNHMVSTMESKTPEIGDGVTFLYWSDRDAGTVVSFDQKRNIVGVTRDIAKRVDTNGMSEDQEYEFTQDPNATVKFFKKLKTGDWVGVVFNQETKRWNQYGTGTIVIGKRDKYHDFSF